MVSIVKRKIGKKYYNHFHTSYKENGKTINIWLNTKKFQSIDEGKKHFLYLIVQKRWQNDIDQILRNYSNSLRKMPNIAKLKYYHAIGIRYVHSTNKIEGSTLSLLDVKNIIDDNRIQRNHVIKPNDVIEATSHMKAYEEMMEYKGDIGWEIVLNWHEGIFTLTKPNIAGNIREWEVEITGSKYTPPKTKEEILDLMKKLFKWYDEAKDRISPVLLSCLFSLRFVSIHPFGDGNGRIARLLMNFILFKNNYPIFIIEPELKNGYFKALERTQITNDESIFVSWFYRTYIKSNERYLDKKKDINNRLY
ncbi:MAG: Fic family protein [Promethearchaeota archaeon]